MEHLTPAALLVLALAAFLALAIVYVVFVAPVTGNGEREAGE